MSDEKGIVPRKALVKSGTAGFGGVAGGGFLLALGASTGPFGVIAGAIVGALLTLGGGAIALSDKDDRVAGGVVAGVGVFTLLGKLLGWGFANGILIAGGIGLLGFGAWRLFKFFKGLRSRR